MRRPPPEPTKEEIIKNVVQGSKLPADWQQGNAKLNGRRFSSLIGNALMTEVHTQQLTASIIHQCLNQPLHLLHSRVSSGMCPHP